MRGPKVSIITVVFNGEKFLDQAIQSVAAQSYEPIEYIVVDGGSTDTSLSIIECRQDVIDRWVSEPDEGIYDAMNKGIRLATGEYLFFLNADDFFSGPEVVERMVGRLADGEAGYCGMVRMVDAEGRGLYTMRTVPDDPFAYLMHQGFLYKRELHMAFGYYNVTFRVNGDYDFYLRLLKGGQRLIYGDDVICHMRVGGVSGTMGYLSAVETLYIQVRSKLPVSRALRIFHLKLIKIMGKSLLVSLGIGRAVYLLKRRRV